MPKKKLGRKKKSQNKLPQIHISNQTFTKLKILLSLCLILLASVFLNLYINTKFPKSNQSFQNINSLEIKQNGSIRVDPNLMKDQNVSEQPTRVVIPDANIDLNVVEAPVKDGFWETSETNASHGMGSANPGQKGNSVIFAHARVGLFYNLKDVKKDDIVYIFTSEKWYAYKIIDITSVYPNQIEVIAPSKDQRLTLYTCTGYSDSKRLIIVAKPIKQS